jgi:hypothetical protein
MPQAIGEEAAKFHSSLESGKQGDPNSMKTVQFTETPDPMVPGAWRGRGSGKGWRAITSRVTTTTTHWQVLGWGARPLARSEGEGGDEVAGEERWMVVWFQATPLADEGIDIYCDRDEGLSREAADDIIGALKGLHAPATVHAVETDMMRLVIDLPDKYMHS